MPNSGGSCATKQSCEPSRSSNPSPLHTMPRTSSPSRLLHRPLGLLHLVDQTDEAMDKSVKIYKPVRWGMKSFLLCEAKKGYILDAEIYTSRVKDRHWPLLRSAGSVVRCLVENAHVTNKNHMLFMDRFYNSVALFHLLKNALGVLAAGTIMPSRKHYPKELGKRLTERGRYEFRCRGGLCAIAWRSVCHCLEGPQAHPLPEKLPRPEESVHCEQACGGQARRVDHATACG